jgi:hypothetical protein
LRAEAQSAKAGARRRTNAGKRAQRFIASTTVDAFRLQRINDDVLSRVTDVASSQQIVDA